ncbi:MAG: iron ABC transporter permease, partial [Rhodospirillaceae bacterium]|nr:iron ABC transporter permease [Rhodospirillaceae bacterium]
MAASTRQDRSLLALLIAGAVGLVLLPWYALESGFWGFAWLAAYPDASAAPALLQAAWHDRGWLWPLFLALALPLPALFGHRH